MPDGCQLYADGRKIYECYECSSGYNSVKCPDSADDDNCLICYKCEITYCNECTGNVCTKCLDNFYLNNNECSFCNSNC